jgi:hypothetical protein
MRSDEIASVFGDMMAANVSETATGCQDLKAGSERQSMNQFEYVEIDHAVHRGDARGHGFHVSGIAEVWKP